MSSFEPLVFSGVQPTGNLQLGNYLGAIKRWVELQNSYNCIYCVVDMHALTTNPAPEKLIQHTREVVAAFLASGIDPKKHIVFNQSRVYQHAELAWIFNCIARIGWMNRMTQFKDKVGRDREKASLGLFAYPSLMAADILVYRATHVPVGEDQRQHLELTRDIAQKFNSDYSHRIESLGIGINLKAGDEIICGFFPIAEPLISETSMRIMSLRDGTKKMSKSDPSDLSRINLDDTPDDIARKIRKAKTDSGPFPETMEELKNKPEADNLAGIYAALDDRDKESVLAEFRVKQFSDFKLALIDILVEKLSCVSSELRHLKNDPAYIDSVLKDGSRRASVIAEKNMKHIRDIVGLLQD
ncbi:MAG: tryptophanyl-tRNA synthetase [Candidatus Tokpelaia sp. JSC189]|nr:MAG: tryptophanyl-tRNA synthetase [Candidatus Tokpelaia sp. JSC189]